MIFSIKRTLTFDFGSARTVVGRNGVIVFDEPTLVSYIKQGGAAIGRQASLMREVPYSRSSKPILNGYVAAQILEGNR